MDDSIYSLGFICQINDELMEQNFDIVKGHFRGKAKEKVEAGEGGEEEEALNSCAEIELPEKDSDNDSIEDCPD